MRDDVAVFDQQTTPRRNAAVAIKIIADNLKLRLVTTASVRVAHLARLNERPQIQLPVFEANRDIRIAFRPPEEVVILPETPAPIEIGDGAEHSVRTFKTKCFVGTGAAAG